MVANRLCILHFIVSEVVGMQEIHDFKKVNIFNIRCPDFRPMDHRFLIMQRSVQNAL